jgi:hypothetical protein
MAIQLVDRNQSEDFPRRKGMRVFATVLLSMSLMALPLWANSDKEASAEETPAAASSTPATADKPAAVKPESSAIESEVEDLRSLVEEQRAELESQRAALKAQQLKMEALEEKLGATASEPASTPAVTSTAVSKEIPAEAPAPIGVAPRTLSASMSPAQEEKPGPLYFKIGAAEFYPLGFMDAMNIFRTTQLGTLGTSFGSVAYTNTVAGRLTEDRFSVQNSRIGLRTHAKFGPADVTGYLEADFLGYQPPNANDTSNSNTLRMRLFWVDYKQSKWEVLGGQSWSFLTPNRNGLSALPGDIFYSQDVDTNYQLGLTWARQATIRVIAHPNNNVAIGVAFENPEQTLPSSVAVPGGLNYASQFDSNSGNTSSSTGVNNPNTPNLHPDIIAKMAFDAKPGGHGVHFDFAGLFRTFKIVNLVATPSSITAANTVTDTIHGGGVEGNVNVELLKNFRLVANGFYSSGGGRYIGSTGAPDVIIRPDGNLSGVHSGSGIGGFEYSPTSNTLFYAYYSGVYIARNVDATVTTPTPTSGTGTCTVTTNSGYGFYPGSSVATGSAVCPSAPGGSSNSANRYLYEVSFGVHHYLWKNASYGDIRLMTQYSYVSRAPWYVATGAPATAHNSMVYIDLRYDLP